MSILLVSPSTKDTNMSLHSFCNCSSFWISLKASSYDVNYTLTLASCCTNTAHLSCSSLCSPWFRTSLLLSTLNSSFMQAFSKIHTPCSHSNFWWPSLKWHASCYRSSYFEVKVVRSCCKLLRFKLGLSKLLASWISPFKLGRVSSNSLMCWHPFFTKQIVFFIESLSYIDFVDLKVFQLAPRASSTGPTPIFCQKKLKLSGISTLAYSILSSVFLISTVC